MRDKLNNILLGLLWMLAVTLGACFWFNTRFGFNIFSSAHWQYLAYMQAANASVSPMFYISLALIIIVAIVGLYFFIRPRFRRIRFARPGNATGQKKSTRPEPEKTQIAPARATDNTAYTVDIMRGETQTAPATPRPAYTAPRPPRLNLDAGGGFNATASTTPTTPTPAETQTREYPEIREIFENAGYTVKKTPTIEGLRPAVIAIGTDEQMWIGAVDVENKRLRAVMDRFASVFADTLDGIEIDIHGFIVAPNNAIAGDGILTFENVDGLRRYIAAHPNTAPQSDGERESFDAYSEYIDTVLNYIGKS